jgi:hypothetical protein
VVDKLLINKKVCIDILIIFDLLNGDTLNTIIDLFAGAGGF